MGSKDYDAIGDDEFEEVLTALTGDDKTDHRNLISDAIVSVVSLHWQQFLAVFGAGSETLRTDVSWKPEPLPILYVTTILSMVLLFELLPYLEEFWRGLRANRGRLVPTMTKDASSD